jgi:hypothetical protein
MSTVINCDIPFQGRRGAHQRVMLLVCKSDHALVEIPDRWRIGEPEMIPASTRTLPCPVQTVKLGRRSRSRELFIDLTH